MGADQNACTRSCIEDYWGNIGAKIQFLPQNHPENHPEIHPGKCGAGLGCVTVSQLSVIPQEPPKDTPNFLSLKPSPMEPRHIGYRREALNVTKMVASTYCGRNIGINEIP